MNSEYETKKLEKLYLLENNVEASKLVDRQGLIHLKN